jgi:hypothetical protein
LRKSNCAESTPLAADPAADHWRCPSGLTPEARKIIGAIEQDGSDGAASGWFRTDRFVEAAVYLEAGISGAIRHLACMKGSKTVVAIYKDT